MNTDLYEEDAPCTCCGVSDLLHPGGILRQPICAICTFTHGVAPDVLAGLLGQGRTRLELDGSDIDLRSPLAAVLMARKLTERHREKGATALLRDWAGADELRRLMLRHKARATKQLRRRS